MDREIVLGILALLAGGLMLLASALVPQRVPAAASAGRLERLCWLRIWQTLLPAALAIASVIGWALREPDNAEGLPWWVLAPCVLFAVPPVRAMVRALRTAVTLPSGVVVGTTGFLRPRVIVAPTFEQTVDVDAYCAALEHEAAHVRHFDPLRLWAAQFVTDLQWPSRAPRGRLARWRNALELARDEEARRRGIDGADLAAAVIAAAQLGQLRGAAALGLEDDEADLRERIARLLAPLPVEESDAGPGRVAVAVASSLFAAVVLGAVQGEHVVRALAGSPP